MNPLGEIQGNAIGSVEALPADLEGHPSPAILANRTQYTLVQGLFRRLVGVDDDAGKIDLRVCCQTIEERAVDARHLAGREHHYSKPRLHAEAPTAIACR